MSDDDAKGLFHMFGAALKCFQVAFAGEGTGYLKISIYSELNLNQYSVVSPCRNVCTVCGSPPCPDLNLIHYIVLPNDFRQQPARAHVESDGRLRLLQVHGAGKGDHGAVVGA